MHYKTCIHSGLMRTYYFTRLYNDSQFLAITSSITGYKLENRALFYGYDYDDICLVDFATDYSLNIIFS